IDAPDAVLTGHLADASDQLRRRQPLPIDADRQPLLEGDLEIGRLLGRILPGLRPGERLFGRLDGRILQRASLDAASPEVLVDGERALLAGRHLDAVLL